MSDFIGLLWAPFSALGGAVGSLCDGRGQLTNFTPWLEATFGLSLAYSVLLHFSTFSGCSLENWADDEKLRVIPALAETANFDEPKFTGDIDSLEGLFLKLIKIVNLISIGWCLVAAILAFYFLSYAGFYPNSVVTLQKHWLLIFVVSGPVPVGFFILFIIHWIDRGRMRSLSKDFSGVLKYNKQKPAEQVGKAREALRTKLRQTREDKRT